MNAFRIALIGRLGKSIRTQLHKLAPLLSQLLDEAFCSGLLGKFPAKVNFAGFPAGSHELLDLVCPLNHEEAQFSSSPGGLS